MIPTDSWLQHTATDSLGRTFDWVRLLGRGGFGEVYLARMHSPSGLEQQVAVKLLPAGLAPDSRAVVRLRDEARVLASLRHPVVLAPHDLAELAGRVALVTEFIEGEDLASCIDPHDPAPLPVSTQLEVLEQVASALEVAWQQLRLVHRDVKPQNIRIGRHGNVKLLDFGLASSELAERAARTSSDVLVGTIRYLAPERFDTQRDPTPASDVYSLGCVLFEGVAGTPFLSNASVPTLVQRIAQTDEWERSVDERLAIVPDLEVRALLKAMLAHDPSLRPTAAEVRERCEVLRTADASSVRLSRWCRDRRWPAADPVEIDSSRTPSPSARGHLDEAQLAKPELSADESAHVTTCVRCRTARRILLDDRTGWSGAWSGEISVSRPPPARQRLKRVALAVAALLLVGVVVLGVTWTQPPPPENALAVATPMPSPPERSAVSAPAVEAGPQAPVPTTVPVAEATPRKREPPVTANAELVEVWVKTRPHGHVEVGGRRWGTEDRKMRLAPGKHVLHLESYDQRYDAEVPIDIVAGRLNSLCWDLVKDAPCSY